MVKRLPKGDERRQRMIHRFWEQTGNFYARGHGQRQPDRSLHRPLGVMPAGIGALPRHDRDPLRAPRVDRRELHRLRQLLHGLPRYRDPRPGERGRGRCSTPWSSGSRSDGHSRERRRRHLPSAVRRPGAQSCARSFASAGETDSGRGAASRRRSTATLAKASDLGDAEKASWLHELEFELSRGARTASSSRCRGPTTPCRRRRSPGSGGLLSITVNPLHVQGLHGVRRGL